MKFSIIFSLSLLAACAQAYTVESLSARSSGVDLVDFTTRELVEELQDRLVRRTSLLRKVTGTVLEHAHGKVMGGGGSHSSSSHSTSPGVDTTTDGVARRGYLEDDALFRRTSLLRKVTGTVLEHAHGKVTGGGHPSSSAPMESTEQAL